MADPTIEPGDETRDAGRQGTAPPPAPKPITPGTTGDADWESIQHPGKIPGSDDPYGTRPVSELTPPQTIADKADIAAIRMMEREKAAREKADREKIMTAAAMGAAATGTAISAKETTAVKPVTGAVVPPGTETVMPLRPHGTLDGRSRMHAGDQGVHPDWETQPQINAPRDVGIPTTGGQSDAARLSAGRRRSDDSKDAPLDRRGGEFETPMSSGARQGLNDERGTIQKVKDDRVASRDVNREKPSEGKEELDHTI
jgi:hypothetical protein